MSEYQYYEFQTIDKPLTKAQQDKVRALSSRAEVDARSARFVYNYGDFRGDEEALMWDYYDAMLYMANWGTRRLLLRFPLVVVDTEAWAEYTVEEAITLQATDKAVLLELIFQEIDPGAWLEGEGWLPSLLALREDLQHGDLRLLYLAWLKATSEYGMIDDNALEPPVPAGLSELSDAHQAFIELFELDPSLVAAAAQASPPLLKEPAPSLVDFEESLSGFMDKLKTRLTQAAAGGSLKDVGAEMGIEMSETLYGKAIFAPGQRTVAQLRELTKNAAEQLAAAERQRQEAERLRALEALAKREPQAWQQVEDLCERKTASAYDEAVTLLVQLNELAQQRGETIDTRLAPLLERWKKRPALLRRLRQKGIV